jgi:thiol-disulfide isomerase/thioredoxin
VTGTGTSIIPARLRSRRWVGLFPVAVVFMCAGCRTQEGDNGALPDPSLPSSGARVSAIEPPPQGDIAPIVRGEYERSQRAGRQLVVYVGATWCEPCERFRHAVENRELDATFPKLTLLEFDADRDSERLRVAGYSARYIPMFALPRADGIASGKQVEGGIKGNRAVSFVSDKLKGLLAEN